MSLHCTNTTNYIQKSSHESGVTCRSWPTLLSFLEKAQANAQARFPELVSLAEKAKETAAVNIAPDPIDELSSVAKSRVMSKLRKKVFMTPPSCPTFTRQASLIALLVFAGSLL